MPQGTGREDIRTAAAVHSACLLTSEAVLKVHTKKYVHLLQSDECEEIGCVKSGKRWHVKRLTSEDGPEVTAPVASLQGHIPQQCQRHHHEELCVGDPGHQRVSQHPISRVQDGVLIHQVLGSHP